MSSRRHAGALALILVLAAALRLVDLGREGLWTDEATSVLYAQQALPDLLRVLRADIQAPAYYLLLKGALSVLGTSEAAARVLSVLAGLAAVAACALAGRRPLGDRGSLLAALVLALHPLHVAFSREARAYSFLGLLLVLAFAAVDAVRRRPTWGRAALAGLLVGLLPLTHGLGGIQGLAIALVAGLPGRGEWDEWRRAALPKLVVAGALAVALAAPWLASSRGQGAHVGVAYSWAQPAWDAVFPWQVPSSLAMLAPATEAPERSLAPELGPAAMALAGLAAAVIGLGWLARRRLPDPGFLARSLAAILAALALTFGASLAIGPLHVVGRVEAALAPLAALVLGGALAAIAERWPRWRLVAAALLLLPAARPLHAVLTSDARSFERELCAKIVGEAGPDDAVLVLGAYRFALEHYLDRAGTRPWIAGYPADREIHPSWIDAAAHDDARLAREAGDLVARSLARLDATGGDDAWLLAPAAGRESDALRGALGERMRLVGRWSAWDSGWTVDRWQPLERPSDAAATP